MQTTQESRRCVQSTIYKNTDTIKLRLTNAAVGGVQELNKNYLVFSLLRYEKVFGSLCRN